LIHIARSPPYTVPSFLNPPRSPFPLLPYTTLFRSASCSRAASRASCSPRSTSSPQVNPSSLRGLPNASSRRTSHRPNKRRQLRRDRKSTRLNSSHDQISYAVFCLEKKNI